MYKKKKKYVFLPSDFPLGTDSIKFSAFTLLNKFCFVKIIQES